MVSARTYMSALVTALLFSALTSPPDSAFGAVNPLSNQPVLLELFTSEGCSSCPAADKLLSQLQTDPGADREVIILSEHVDYWNHLGWHDNYSSTQFTDRQRAFAGVFGQHNVYTPEVVVDGRDGMVGSSYNSISRALTKARSAAKINISLSVDSTLAPSLKTKIIANAQCPANLVGKQVELYLAVAEDSVTSKVRSGENGGSTLSHSGIVRSLRKIKEVKPNTQISIDSIFEIKLDPSWQKRNLRLVAFLQDSESKRIVGCKQTRIFQ